MHRNKYVGKYRLSSNPTAWSTPCDRTSVWKQLCWHNSFHALVRPYGIDRTGRVGVDTVCFDTVVFNRAHMHTSAHSCATAWAWFWPSQRIGSPFEQKVMYYHILCALDTELQVSAHLHAITRSCVTGTARSWSLGWLIVSSVCLGWDLVLFLRCVADIFGFSLW